LTNVGISSISIIIGAFCTAVFVGLIGAGTVGYINPPALDESPYS